MLKDDLDIQVCNLIVLDDYNPLSLEEVLDQIQPSILWVSSSDGNAFDMRYKMRTSGLDTFIERSCGSPEGSSSLLYVGEGAGAICGGSFMSVAHVRGDDPKGAPEPQFRGLELLGPQKSVAFGMDEALFQSHDKTKDLTTDSITCLQSDQVFVFSQRPDNNSVMSFVMTPSRRGMIENWQSPPPVPPLVAKDGIGGVQCVGEPAIDPSRTMQQSHDSEWLEETG
jgi:hypothetical protein